MSRAQAENLREQHRIAAEACAAYAVRLSAGFADPVYWLAIASHAYHFLRAQGVPDGSVRVYRSGEWP